MKILFTFLIGVVICSLFSSCDTKFYSTGVVIDKDSRLPVDNVKISIKDLDTTLTDSSGRYLIDKFIYGWAGDFDILLEKDGFKPRCVNLSSGKLNRLDAVIEIERTKESISETCLERKYVKVMFLFNKYVLSILNILTILFIVFRKELKRKFIMVATVFLLNPTFFISFTDCSIVKFWLLNGPVYFTHFKIYPYSVKIILPIGAIFFWLFYIFKTEIILKKKK